MYVCVCVCGFGVYVCMYVSMYVCTYVCMHAFMYIYICICTYVCMFLCPWPAITLLQSCRQGIYVALYVFYVCICIYICAFCFLDQQSPWPTINLNCIVGRVCMCEYVYVCMYTYMPGPKGGGHLSPENKFSYLCHAIYIVELN